MTLYEVLSAVTENKTLKKAVLSKPRGADMRRADARLVSVRGEVVLQLEYFKKDNGVIHKNIPLSQAARFLTDELENSFSRLNIIDENGEAEALRSKNGAVYFKNGIKEFISRADVSIPAQNEEKSYILSPHERYDFLVALGIQDKAGRIYDKKQSKFRQINRFLEILGDVSPTHTNKICVWDLCCGKSYLTFAVYYYLTHILGKEAEVYGVDLKRDVIAFCSECAEKLGFEGLRFVHGDISKTDLPCKPDIVISLHACDTATDTVLENAVLQGAEVILSSPCCHHELSSRIKPEGVEFITEYPLLKQKFAALATDALRCLGLEACGYEVQTVEFIDPEETPKNLMIRAVRKRISQQKQAQLAKRYHELCVRFNAVERFS